MIKRVYIWIAVLALLIVAGGVSFWYWKTTHHTVFSHEQFESHKALILLDILKHIEGFIHPFRFMTKVMINEDDLDLLLQNRQFNRWFFKYAFFLTREYSPQVDLLSLYESLKYKQFLTEDDYALFINEIKPRLKAIKQDFIWRWNHNSV